MEERNKKGNGDGCGCGVNGACSCGAGSAGAMCGCGGGMMIHRHFLLRIVILLALIGFVFWSGVKMGELKERFGGSLYGGRYGGYVRMYNMMDGTDQGWGVGTYGPGMIGWRQATGTPR